MSGENITAPNTSVVPRKSTSQTSTQPPRLWNLLIALVLSGMVLHFTFEVDKTKFDEAALGGATTSVFASHDGQPVHGHLIVEVDQVLAAAQNREAAKHVLWLGNSQLHAINQFEEGQKTASGLVFERLRPAGIEVLTLSFPNANLQEHLLAFHYGRARLERLRMLVLPVVYDDLRETGIRHDLRPMLDDTRVRDALGKTEIGRKLASELPAGGSAAAEGAEDFEGIRDTLQERSEAWLTGWLDRHWALWQYRASARGHLFLGLYQLRNTVLGITPQSKRALRRSTYEPNMAALRALLASAHEKGVRVLVYVPPLRGYVEPPYVIAEYEQFQETLKALAKEEYAMFADYGDLVPGGSWGQKQSTGIA